MPEKRLSKSRFMNGLQCRRYLWIATNEPARLPEVDPGTQHRFDEGHLVGELARTLFPGGVGMETLDTNLSLLKTREIAGANNPFFEAGAGDDRVYSRLDILEPVGNGCWNIIEVKSSTRIKDEYIPEVAFQKYCCARSGIKVDKARLMYISKDYVKDGAIDPAQLFIIEDISDKVDAAGAGLEDFVEDLIAVTRLPECPGAAISPNCNHPYECPLVQECWAFLPERNIFDLYRGGVKCFEMFARGIQSVRDIPGNVKLSGKQQVQRACEINDNPHVDRKEIAAFIRSLKYPLYFLDFETFATVIPIYDGTRPYQNIPFQYSLHRIENQGAEPVHFEFLGDGKGDPRQALLAQLQKDIGTEGSVMVYTSYEQRVLEDLAKTFPGSAEGINNVISRIADLYDPFGSFHYYHPDQRGSASIKSVLPALTGRGYEGMNIKEGIAASLAYLDIMSGRLTPEEVQQIRRDLLDYCGLDTMAMVEILGKLDNLK